MLHSFAVRPGAASSVVVAAALVVPWRLRIGVGGRAGGAFGLAEVVPLHAVQRAGGFCSLIFGAAFLRRQTRRRIGGGSLGVGLGSVGGFRRLLGRFGVVGGGRAGLGAAFGLAVLVPGLPVQRARILGGVVLGAALGHGQRIGRRCQKQGHDGKARQSCKSMDEHGVSPLLPPIDVPCKSIALNDRLRQMLTGWMQPESAFLPIG